MDPCGLWFMSLVRWNAVSAQDLSLVLAVAFWGILSWHRVLWRTLSEMSWNWALLRKLCWCLKRHSFGESESSRVFLFFFFPQRSCITQFFFFKSLKKTKKSNYSSSNSLQNDLPADETFSVSWLKINFFSFALTDTNQGKCVLLIWNAS